MIELRNVRKSFGQVQAVRDVSFDASTGSVVGLLGPNGAGKTTTIRMITGALPPTAGAVRVDGLDSIADSIAVRRRIGYMPESAALYPEMRVESYLSYRATLQGLRGAKRRSAVGVALDRCWLTDVRRRRIGVLSKGYRQRVALAAALVHDPPVLILDEPTSGLDPQQIIETRSLLRELAATRTTLICSHILSEVEQTCDRVVMLIRGQVRAQGAVGELALKLGDQTRYIVEVQGASDSASLQKTLTAIPGADQVRIETAPGDGHSSDDAPWLRAVITPHSDADDLRQQLARAMDTAGLFVRELRRDAPTLERLFMRLLNETPASQKKEPTR